jgi:hypothetical protein
LKTRVLAGILLCVASAAANAYSFLYGYDEAPTVAQALERVKGQQGRHVLVYFGMPKGCPQCNYTRSMLSSPGHAAQWKPNYVAVNVDIYDPTPDGRALMEQHRIRWAPVLVFLDASGKRVAYARQLRNEKEVVLLNEFVSQKLYVKTDFGKYYAANFEARGAERTVPVTKVAAAPRIDDRPRLRDVLAQKHERLTGDALKALLAGRRMLKENQDWFLTLDLAAGNSMQASGKRKDGTATMQGAGKWYVTRKGKLCLELTGGGVDENWCRHVFRAGEAYYVVKDLRPDRLAYRFALEQT